MRAVCCNASPATTISNVSQRQDDLYRQAATAYGDALDRLVKAYELDPDKRRDLLQEIHLALWRSFESFEARCSLRTWVYRIAHNLATSWVIRQRRSNSRLLFSVEELEAMPEPGDQVRNANERMETRHPLCKYTIVLACAPAWPAASAGAAASLSSFGGIDCRMMVTIPCRTAPQNYVIACLFIREQWALLVLENLEHMTLIQCDVRSAAAAAARADPVLPASPTIDGAHRRHSQPLQGLPPHLDAHRPLGDRHVRRYFLRL